MSYFTRNQVVLLKTANTSQLYYHWLSDRVIFILLLRHVAIGLELHSAHVLRLGPLRKNVRNISRYVKCLM